MTQKKKYIGDLQITNWWFMVVTGCVILLLCAFFVQQLLLPVFLIVSVAVLASLIDYILLFFVKGTIRGHRIMAPRFSIGDDNKVDISIVNSFPFRIRASIIDELPVQFQVRDFDIRITMQPLSRTSTSYNLRPLTRGEFYFGDLLFYASSPIGLLQRRFVLSAAEWHSDTNLTYSEVVKVYPAFQQLKKFQLQLLGNYENKIPGLKKTRRLGHSLEFEKIKEYVAGDDVRTINWKATARRGNLMVNTYTDARQQQIYCLIDKGRNMKMPFEGMTLLDYSINAALALANVALMKYDKAGLITFSNKVNDVVPADRRNNQMHLILETLYKQRTDFKESDYEAVWGLIRRRITQRSVILFFTNFETMSSLERQLPFLKRIAQSHLVCVIFFQNTLLREIDEKTPDSIEGIYIKTIAAQFAYEKRQIVKELRRHGMLTILTTPQDLSVDVINKYLEMKARQLA